MFKPLIIIAFLAGGQVAVTTNTTVPAYETIEACNEELEQNAARALASYPGPPGPRKVLEVKCVTMEDISKIFVENKND